jgi:hypothetical protein
MFEGDFAGMSIGVTSDTVKLAHIESETLICFFHSGELNSNLAESKKGANL